jgi:hypothetical protein
MIDSPDLRAADRALARAADEIEDLLRGAARRLRPFPPFPGALFTFGVEAEADGVRDRGVGCIVVTETGDMKELQIGIDAEGAGMLGPADPVSMREEQLVDVELPPYDRLLFAEAGLRAVTALLEQQEADASVAPPSDSVGPD